MSKLNVAHIQVLGQKMTQKPESVQMGIKAKTDIQMTVLSKITMPEKIMLSKDIVATSLENKVIDTGKEYWKQKNSTDEMQLFAVALAVGTILKELDNGNEKYVSNEGVLEIINRLN